MRKFARKVFVVFAIALTGLLIWHRMKSYQATKHTQLALGIHTVRASEGYNGAAIGTSTGINAASNGTSEGANVATFGPSNTVYEIVATGGSPQESVAEEREEEEIISLIQHKFKVLKDAGMLRNPMQRNCSTHEYVKNKCVDTNCKTALPESTSKENIRSILKPVRNVGRKKLREAIDAFALKPTGKKYSIITGASSDHFGEVQAAIELLHKNVFPHLSNFSFYFYDLGLNEQQRMLVRNFSGAELLKFPFDEFSSSTRYLKCYLWKPLIILAHLQVTEYLVWLDATIAYMQPMNSYLKTLATTGILTTPSTYQMAQHCSSNFFKYFGDEACQYSVYDEIQGGHMLLHNEPFTQRVLLEPWAACALDPECMCPPETRKMLICPANIRKYSKCHRYDQSAITLLMAKVFRESVASVHIQKPIHIVKHGHRSNFLFDLSNQGKRKKL